MDGDDDVLSQNYDVNAGIKVLSGMIYQGKKKHLASPKIYSNSLT